MLQAQSPLNEAKTAYQKKDLSAAMSKIEEAETQSNNLESYDFWEAKGIIYYDYYKTDKEADSLYKMRTAALEAFVKGIELSEDETNKARLTKKLNSASNSCYNSAIEQAQGGNIKNAEIGIQLFLKNSKIANASINTLPLQLQYAHVKAIYYEQQYKKEGKESDFNSSKTAYEEGIHLDNKDFEGNFHIALLYYNRSVDLIDQLDFVDIDEMRLKEEEAIELHKKALPYALKAYEVQPDNAVLLEMLEGIYFNIRDFAKADEFKALLER